MLFYLELCAQFRHRLISFHFHFNAFSHAIVRARLFSWIFFLFVLRLYFRFLVLYVCAFCSFRSERECLLVYNYWLSSNFAISTPYTIFYGISPLWFMWMPDLFFFCIYFFCIALVRSRVVVFFFVLCEKLLKICFVHFFFLFLLLLIFSGGMCVSCCREHASYSKCEHHL